MISRQFKHSKCLKCAHSYLWKLNKHNNTKRRYLFRSLISQWCAMPCASQLSMCVCVCAFKRLWDLFIPLSVSLSFNSNPFIYLYGMFKDSRAKISIWISLATGKFYFEIFFIFHSVFIVTYLWLKFSTPFSTYMQMMLCWCERFLFFCFGNLFLLLFHVTNASMSCSFPNSNYEKKIFFLEIQSEMKNALTAR